jgi:hypothetical protein
MNFIIGALLLGTAIVEVLALTFLLIVIIKTLKE